MGFQIGHGLRRHHVVPQLPASAIAPLLGLLAIFFLITARYGAALNLWGDEAYSLNVATKPVGEILAADPPFTCPPTTCCCIQSLAFFPQAMSCPCG
jgi:hypothetical protein